MTKMMSEFMFYKDRQVIFSHAEVIDALHDFSKWKRTAGRQFSIKLHDSEFPCIFSKSAWKAKSIKFVFCEKRKDSKYLDFLHNLVSYGDYINDTSLSKRLLSPLVVFFSPEFYINKNQHLTGYMPEIVNHGQRVYQSVRRMLNGHFVLMAFNFS